MSETFLLGLYGATLSTSFLVWQIVQHRLKSRPRAKLKVTFARIACNIITRYETPTSFQRPESISTPARVSLEIANIGEVPICLEEGGLLVTRRKRLVGRAEGRLCIPPDWRTYPVPLPRELARGQSYPLFCDAIEVQAKLADLEPGFRLTHVYFRDATNRRYEKKLPRRFVTDLLTLKRP